MDAKMRAAELYDAWDNRTITREEIAAALNDARAAGYAEAIEGAAKVAEAEYMSLSGHPDYRNAKFIAKRIRALAPTDKEKP
jgi:hypothetical protein